MSDPSGVEMVSSFVSISADEGVEMGFLTDFFSKLVYILRQDAPVVNQSGLFAKKSQVRSMSNYKYNVQV